MEQCLPQPRGLLGQRVYAGVVGGPALPGGSRGWAGLCPQQPNVDSEEPQEGNTQDG